ncbi:MAG TPA: zinc ribbon domain-containing protein [Holophagaceae bacterium]|nr:zinc ribbon domain-containing protein [Holophagaceae bacterium]
MDTAPPQFRPFEPPTAPPPREGRSPWTYALWGCGGAFLLVLLLAGSCLGFLAHRGSELTPACETYLAEVQRGDYAGAYAGTARAFRTKGWDQATFLRFEGRMQRALGHLESKSRVGVQVFPGTARLSYQAQYTTGPVLITFVLAREDGAWRITGVNYASPVVAAGLACPACGAPNRWDAVYCARCGKALPDPQP